MEIYLIANNYLKRSLKHKVIFLVALILPILLCFIALLIDFEGKAKLRIGILGTDVKEFSVDGVHASIANEDTLYTDLIMGKYHFIIDQDSHAITIENNKQKEYYQKVINDIQQGIKLDEEYTGAKNLSKTERSLGLLMTMFLVMATINGSMIIKDKKVGTFNRCLYSMKSSIYYILGNYLFNLVITIFQISIGIMFMKLIYRDQNISILSSVVLILFISIVVTCYATLICMLCKSDVQANIVSSSLAAIFSIIGGAFVTINNMPVVLQYASIISPVRWIMELSRLLI